MLVLRDIAVWLHGREEPVLDGITLHINEGECVQLTGASGSGKSTLVRAAAGLLPVSSGTVAMGSSACGFVDQDPAAQMLAHTVAAEVAFPLESRACDPREIGARVGAVLEGFGLAEHAWDPVRSLSGGQQQLVSIATAMAAEPGVLVLDEPTSQLDEVTAERVLAAIDRAREAGCAVLMTTQRASDLVWGDRVVALHRGRIAYDGRVEDAWNDLDMCQQLAIPVPESARIVHALRAAGVDLAMPVTMNDLVSAL